jgi:hypothetical protein
MFDDDPGCPLGGSGVTKLVIPIEERGGIGNEGGGAICAG